MILSLPRLIPPIHHIYIVGI
jgi:hypothetical protein